MKLGYYDCWIGRARYKRGVYGMNFGYSNKRMAISETKRLLKFKPDKEFIGVVRFRERGEIGDIRTWHKLPVVWRSDV